MFKFESQYALYIKHMMAKCSIYKTGGCEIIMPKQSRAYSKYSTEALALLGQLIRIGRIERKITGEELASRAGISRVLLWRIEKGDPSCAIGSVFEAASIAGVSLFEPDREQLGNRRATAGEMLRLLPKYARRPRRAVKDDF
jgi:transcriptional regulator with XRE-family HTH domain